MTAGLVSTAFEHLLHPQAGDAARGAQRASDAFLRVARSVSPLVCFHKSHVPPDAHEVAKLSPDKKSTRVDFSKRQRRAYVESGERERETERDRERQASDRAREGGRWRKST